MVGFVGNVGSALHQLDFGVGFVESHFVDEEPGVDDLVRREDAPA